MSSIKHCLESTVLGIQVFFFLVDKYRVLGIKFFVILVLLLSSILQIVFDCLVRCGV